MPDWEGLSAVLVSCSLTDASRSCSGKFPALTAVESWVTFSFCRGVDLSDDIYSSPL